MTYQASSCHCGGSSLSRGGGFKNMKQSAHNKTAISMIAKSITLMVSVIFILLAGINTSRAVDIGVMFDASPDQRAVGFRIWYQPGTNKVGMLDVGAALRGTITNATPGLTYQIWVTAYDTNNVDGDASNSIYVPVPDTLPGQVVFLSAKISQTNNAWQVNVQWQPAPYQENVTGYKMDVIQDGIISTNLFTTNTSATVTTVKKALSAVVTPTNYYGWGKSNLVWSYTPAAAPQMQAVFLK